MEKPQLSMSFDRKWWTLSCSLDPKDPDSMTVMLKIRQDCIERVEKVMVFDQGIEMECVDPVRFDARLQAIRDNENMTGTEARRVLTEECNVYDNQYFRICKGWDPLVRASEMRKYWDALNLLVSPAVLLP